MRKSLRLVLAALVMLSTFSMLGMFSTLGGSSVAAQGVALAQAVFNEEAPAPDASGEEADLPSDYVIGAEDILGILVWREAEMSGDATVRSDGMITLPLVGDLEAAGLRPEELARKIETLAAVYLTEPNVTVVARQINSRKVFITGEVSAPGVQPLSGPLTVMQLIALAGGLTEWADEDKIQIMRVGDDGRTTAIRFNYEWIRKGKRLDQNILLKPGDTVVVP